MSVYRYTSTESPVDHADHVWEEYHAYLDSNRPDDVDPDASGLCCHSCLTIVL